MIILMPFRFDLIFYYYILLFGYLCHDDDVLPIGVVEALSSTSKKIRNPSSGSSSNSDSVFWQPLPEVQPPATFERRQVFTTTASKSAKAAAAAALLLGGGGLPTTAANAVDHEQILKTSSSGGSSSSSSSRPCRSVISIDSHLSIPVWPTWGGGRVVPVALQGQLQDPFLLLAHHKHWFDPHDPLRGPFKQVGAALGLPYVDVEGFAMHPHRGFDIWTYVIDGSDGFRHRDSLGGQRTYRGGTVQWMRSGNGVLHEEFWETRGDRRTNIELFQLWVNLPSFQKMDPPAIRYLGQDSTTTPWIEREIPSGGGWVRDLSSTLNNAISLDNHPGNNNNFDGQGHVVRQRPPIEILHVQLDPGGEFTLPQEATTDRMNAILYVRQGTALVPNMAGEFIEPVNALQTATFAHNNGETITIRNAATSGQKGTVLDFLLLAGQPLKEPTIQAGPIVMNTIDEVNDAYQQLQDGTFLQQQQRQKL